MTIVARDASETVAKINAVIKAMESGETIPTEEISLEFENNFRKSKVFVTIPPL